MFLKSHFPFVVLLPSGFLVFSPGETPDKNNTRRAHRRTRTGHAHAHRACAQHATVNEMHHERTDSYHGFFIIGKATFAGCSCAAGTILPTFSPLPTRLDAISLGSFAPLNFLLPPSVPYVVEFGALLTPPPPPHSLSLHHRSPRGSLLFRGRKKEANAPVRSHALPSDRSLKPFEKPALVIIDRVRIVRKMIVFRSIYRTPFSHVSSQ